jgi:Fe-S-cluster containining protein
LLATGNIVNAYLRLCRSVDGEFARNRELHGVRMRCGPGCSDCCGQLFQITEIEAARISIAMRQFDPAEGTELRIRAEKYLEAREQLTGGETWGMQPEAGIRLPCPALADGICRIYEHRPLICRKFGMPIYNPEKPERLLACELNFTSGESIQDPALVQIQTALHNEWKEINGDYNRQGGRREERPLTVARAILEDFSGLIG